MSLVTWESYKVNATMLHPDKKYYSKAIQIPKRVFKLNSLLTW